MRSSLSRANGTREKGLADNVRRKNEQEMYFDNTKYSSRLKVLVLNGLVSTGFLSPVSHHLACHASGLAEPDHLKKL
jgi:hypothetical protein